MNGTWLGDIVIPISVAILGGSLAVLWSLLQARWRGRYFQKLILSEPGEFAPSNNIHETDGQLKSYMKKKFIHKNILDKETENKEYIFDTNHRLIYLTNQLWNAFEDNDVQQFIRYFSIICQERKLGGIKKKYDTLGRAIKEACK